ncbi:MAG: site-specific integrase [Minisyncoccia bacterium]
MRLAEARKMAQGALNSVAHGDDPQQEKENARNGFAFDETVETFLRTHCARFNRTSTAQETARLLNAQFVNRWGRRDLREITRSEVVAVLDRIVANGAPSAGNHALSAVRKFFNWCVERGLIEISPCTAIKKPTPHRSRDRVLSDHELAAIWSAARSVGYPYGSIVQLLILTAQRRGEVTGMRWHDIDFEKSTWSIPAERTKSNRQQILPLVPAAMEIITSLPKLGADHVFPAQGESQNAFSGFSKSKRRLDETSGVRVWTLHDLRRTAATGMASLGVSPHVVERVLNHTSGTLGGVAGVYNRFGYLPEMCAALEKWSEQIRPFDLDAKQNSQEMRLSRRG